MAISRVTKFVREASGLDSLDHAESLRNVDLDIYLAADETGKIAQMALVANALALRCFNGEIRFHFPGANVASLGWSKADLFDLLQEEARLFGDKSRVKRASSEGGSVRLALGVKVENSVIADAAGWLVAVNQIVRPSPLTYSPANTFAVCCALSKLFAAHVLNKSQHLHEKWTRSLSDFQNDDIAAEGEISPSTQLGRITLLGAGAIGTGFMYSLWLSNWQACVEIIDSDSYGEPNHETSLFVGFPEVLKNRKKAQALCALASRPGLILQPNHIRVEKTSEILLSRRDVFVCAVDNPETRRILDKVNAGMLINGGVGGTAEDAGHVLWSRHLQRDLPLSQRYAEREIVATSTRTPPKEIQDECSRIDYDQASLAAPFLGTAVGALLLASCVLKSAGQLSSVNYFKTDLLKLQASCQIENYEYIRT